MNPEVIKLMADLERYRNLRSSIIDEKAKEDLDHLIKETEERLWELENAKANCSRRSAWAATFKGHLGRHHA
jgi:hypothetical protein